MKKLTIVFAAFAMLFLASCKHEVESVTVKPESLSLAVGECEIVAQTLVPPFQHVHSGFPAVPF